MSEIKKINLFDTPAVAGEGNDPFPPIGVSLTGDARREARLCAMQAIYRHLLMDDGFAAIAEDFARDELPKRKADKKVFNAIWQEYVSGQERFLDVVEAHLTAGWTLEKLPLVEKSLLLAAIGELYGRPDAPKAVVINEFIELAKGFLQPDAVGFVNGVLDKVGGAVRG